MTYCCLQCILSVPYIQSNPKLDYTKEGLYYYHMDKDYSLCCTLNYVEHVRSLVKNSIIDALPLSKVKLRSHRYMSVTN